MHSSMGLKKCQQGLTMTTGHLHTVHVPCLVSERVSSAIIVNEMAQAGAISVTNFPASEVHFRQYSSNFDQNDQEVFRW